MAVGGDARLLNDFLPGPDIDEALRRVSALTGQARRRPLGALLDTAVVNDEWPLEAFCGHEESSSATT